MGRERGPAGHPLELELLSSLRVMAKGCDFEAVSEVALISPQTLEVFRSTGSGSSGQWSTSFPSGSSGPLMLKLCPSWVSAPSTLLQCSSLFTPPVLPSPYR